MNIFNLLGDPFIKNDLKFFSQLFNYSNIKINENSEILFEYSNRATFNEYQTQPTSFDFTILNQNSKNIFIEAKYVEAEFGRCSTIENGECDGLNPIHDFNLCYLTSKNRKYWNLMIEYNLGKAFDNSPICPFSIYYQFYRELIFAIENDGLFVLLIDKRNPAFIKIANNDDRGLIPTLLNLIPEEVRSIIKIIYIQDVIPILEDFGYDWTNMFRKKYGIYK
jgi:hypothetical protein